MESSKGYQEKFQHEDYKTCDFETVIDDKQDNNDSIQPMNELNNQIYQEFIKAQAEKRLSISKIKNIFSVTELDPEVQKYLIVDKDTGNVIDGRNNELVAQIVQKNATIGENSQKVWKDFWDFVKQQNEMLIEAAEIGDLQRVQLLLNNNDQRYPIDVNTKALDDWTPLHFAALNDNYEIAKILIEKGANINASTKFERRPIHFAVIKRSLNIINLLIEQKADLNCLDKEFCTPLFYAAEYNLASVVESLLKNGAQGDIPNYQQVYPFEITAMQEIRDIFEKYNQGPSKIQGVNSAGSAQYNGSMRKNMVEKILYQTSHMQQQSQQKPPRQSFSRWQNQQQQQQIIQIQPSDFVFYKLLGKGAFGEVYLVQKDKKNYAMKILKKEKIFGSKLQRYAKTEKDVLSIMNHPFIIKLHYAFQNDQKLFLVMDYCPGGDLGKQLNKQRKFPEQIAKMYIAELILAIEELHKKLIIFRDLKPENILIDYDGHIQLTDFGLAKKDVNENDLNKSFLGTPIYFAPEIITRTGHTRQVDWYQVGVLLYEFIVGQPPYYDPEREHLFEKIKKGPLKLPKSMSENAKDIIKKLVCRNYKKRLGIDRDGEEIREHPFFSDLNWQDVYKKKIPMPKPDIEPFPTKPLNVIFTSEDTKKDQLVEWTFIEPKELN